MVQLTVLPDIRETSYGDVLVLDIAGDCALENISTLRMKLDRVHHIGICGAVIDISGVEMFDTAAMALLMHFKEKCADRGVEMVLVTSDNVRNLLDRVGSYGDWFIKTQSVPEAVRIICDHIAMLETACDPHARS